MGIWPFKKEKNEPYLAPPLKPVTFTFRVERLTFASGRVAWVAFVRKEWQEYEPRWFETTWSMEQRDVPLDMEEEYAVSDSIIQPYKKYGKLTEFSRAGDAFDAGETACEQAEKDYLDTTIVKREVE